jgi:hypothetical protein
VFCGVGGFPAPRLLAGLRPAPPFAQSDPAPAATQGDMALHRSIDGEDSGQPEAEMAAGRNATVADRA